MDNLIQSLGNIDLSSITREEAIDLYNLINKTVYESSQKTNCDIIDPVSFLLSKKPKNDFSLWKKKIWSSKNMSILFKNNIINLEDNIINDLNVMEKSIINKLDNLVRSDIGLDFIKELFIDDFKKFEKNLKESLGLYIPSIYLRGKEIGENLYCKAHNIKGNFNLKMDNIVKDEKDQDNISKINKKYQNRSKDIVNLMYNLYCNRFIKDASFVDLSKKFRELLSDLIRNDILQIYSFSSLVRLKMKGIKKVKWSASGDIGSCKICDEYRKGSRILGKDNRKLNMVMVNGDPCYLIDDVIYYGGYLPNSSFSHSKCRCGYQAILV